VNIKLNLLSKLKIRARAHDQSYDIYCISSTDELYGTLLVTAANY